MTKAEAANAILEFGDGILYVRIKEGAELTVDTMKYQYAKQETIIGDQPYVVLIDGKNTYQIDPEARDMMAKHNPPNRKATAIVSNQNLATLMMGNFYLRFNRPGVPTRLFRTENEALEWLQGKKQ